MKRYLIISLMFLACLNIAKAQPEVTIHYMRNVFQASFVNPTVIPEHTFSTGFSVFGQAITNGFLPQNVLDYRNDSMHVNLNGLLGDMNDKNLIFVGQNLDLFHVRYKVRNSYAWFAIRENLSVNLQYPRDLFSLAIDGNQPYIVDFDKARLCHSMTEFLRLRNLYRLQRSFRKHQFPDTFFFHLLEGTVTQMPYA